VKAGGHREQGLPALPPVPASGRPLPQAIEGKAPMTSVAAGPVRLRARLDTAESLAVAGQGGGRVPAAGVLAGRVGDGREHGPAAVQAEVAERVAWETVDEVVRSAGNAVAIVPVEVRVVQGNSANVLLDQTAGADLLVVGHRGRRGPEPGPTTGRGQR
jgi:nucleotide-binding universal stress UspA family protein